MADAPHFATPAAELLFEQCAAPEAVAARIRTERAALRHLERRVAWLDDLLARRTAERDAGTWPPRQTREETDPR